MISIRRNRQDDEGKEIKPSVNWFSLSKRWTEKSIKERDKHKFQENVYRRREVKSALIELFHGKCAYCESGLARTEWEVEHFRPKGAVFERLDHPGYYWLAYSWANLFPSCKYCNQFRQVRPRWRPEEEDRAGGKGNRFPLSDERTRAMAHSGDIAQEKRLLVDPCWDDPEKHLAYDPTGQIFPWKRSRKGEATIKTFNLSASELRDARKLVIEMMLDLLNIRQMFVENGEIEEVELLDGAINRLTSDARPHAGVCRFVLRNPENFGIEI